MIESVPGLEVEQDVSLKLHWDADWSATDCRHGRAAPSHTFYLRTSVIPRSLTAAWQKSIKQKRGCGGVMVAGSTMTPHTVPDPHPTPPLGAPPQTSSEKNPRPCRFNATDHPHISHDIRRQFGATFPPRKPRCRIMHVNRKAGRACGSRFSSLIKPIEVRVGVVLIIGPACFHVKKAPIYGSAEPRTWKGKRRGTKCREPPSEPAATAMRSFLPWRPALPLSLAVSSKLARRLPRPMNSTRRVDWPSHQIQVSSCRRRVSSS